MIHVFATIHLLFALDDRSSLRMTEIRDNRGETEADDEGSGVSIRNAHSIALAIRKEIRRSCPTEDAIKAFGAPAHCPGTSWIDSIVRADSKRNKVVFDVGCNKGDDAIRWLKRYGNAGFWRVGAWASTMPSDNYACRKPDPNEDKSTVSSQDVPSESDFLEVVCVEAMPNNFKALTTTAKTLGYDATSHSNGSLHLVHAFVGAGDNTSVDFPDGPVGSEALHPSITYRKDSARNEIYETRSYKLIHGNHVPVRSVDGIVQELKLPRVDILTIDTEGADPLVLIGSESALKSVRFLEFEVHRDIANSAWSRTTLKSVIESLSEKNNFDCYFEGNDKLLRITGCWHETYDQAKYVAWTNVVCAKRGDIWNSALIAFEQK